MDPDTGRVDRSEQHVDLVVGQVLGACFDVWGGQAGGVSQGCLRPGRRGGRRAGLRATPLGALSALGSLRASHTRAG
ncbi:hypothetical protein AB0I72_19480 [Nocardiopsis sp. NPDC049922]|uniref:hypothetical protein n=1 Tax=Nocardiopsis sp. NPDC049922 TaxID=3155157 RepID=UPI0033CE274E